MTADSTLLHSMQVRLGRAPARSDLQQALDAAQAQFGRRYPEWAASMFDEHFLAARIKPLLTQNLRWGITLDPSTLAGEWADQFTWPDREARQKRVSELTPAAAHFLLLLEAELQTG